MKHPIAAWFIAVAVILGLAGLGAQAVAAAPLSPRQATGPTASPWSTGTLAETPQGDLTSVSCPTSGFCAAIDRFGNVVTYNGVVWTAPSLADPDTGGIGNPSISCISASFCAVVDDFGYAVLYNGTTWSTPQLIDKDRALDSVSCVSTKFCVAVDLYGYAFIYNGTSWTESTKQIGTGYQLNGVSCASTTFCVAVDNDGNALTYTGASWASSKVTTLELSAVSCVATSSDFCAAVSASGEAAVYSGTSWTLVPITGAETLKAVSCASPTECIAVDEAGNSFVYAGGSTWTSQSVDAHGGGLNSVSCESGDSAGLCAAVDFDGNALIYTGSWSAPLSVDPTSTIGLTSVSCPSESFCAAADVLANVVTYDGTSWGPLVSIPGFGASGNTYVSCASSIFCAAVNAAGKASTFDGTSWSAPVSIDTFPNSVTAVSCAPAFCVAVDNTGNVIVYDGTSWASPVLIDASNKLTAVSCTSSSFCLALDNVGNAFTYGGTSWTTATSIDGTTALTGLSCTSESFCVAVDSAGNALLFGGSSWTTTSIDGTTALTAVSCTSSSFCAAADGAGNTVTYDGKDWSTPLEADSYGAAITGLSCASAYFCAAVDTENYAFVYAPTTTTITSSAAASIVGEPASISVEVTSNVSTRTPNGSVKVTDGVQSCSAQLTGSGGVATGACSLTEQTKGNYDLVASYSPDAEFGGSASTPSPLTVGNANSTTLVVSSAASVTYGDEQVATISVSVTPQYPGPAPTGSVTLKASSTTLCSASLSLGEVKCTLLARQLNAGTYHLTASYEGSADFYGSISGAVPLVVAKQSARTTFKLSSGKVAFGHEQSETFSVTVTPAFPGATPSGKVAVKRGSVTLCTINLSKAKGSCRLTRDKLVAGNYRLSAAYGGNTDFAAATSTKRSLTVTK